jgi:hypothetical protein
MFVIGAGVVLADEIKGKVKSVDAEKSTITLTVENKDTTYDVARFATFGQLTGNAKKPTLGELSGGLKAIKEGADVTVTTEKKDNKEFVSKVVVDATKRKKNK